MADNGILIVYNRIYIFIDKKNKRGFIPLYCSNKMHNKKVEYLNIIIYKKSHILKMVLYKTKTYYYTYIIFNFLQMNIC